MRIVLPEEMKEIDNYCNQHLGLKTLALMDNAASAICNIVSSNFKKDCKILAVCGGGNNGGDGLAAIRKLHDLGYVAKAFVFGTPNENAKLHRENLIKNGVEVLESNLDILLNESDIVLDCMFGIGFKSEINNPVEKYINYINNSGKYIISVDIPSGVYADSGNVSNYAIKADMTVVLSHLKPGNVIYPGREYCGKIIVSDIGIPDSVIDFFSVHKDYLDNSFDLKQIIKKRSKDTHKGDYGKVGIIAGSRGMTGAALLSAESALRSGTGLVYILAPLGLLSIYESSLKEAVKIEIGTQNDYYFSEKHFEKAFEVVKKLDSVIIGPGLGTRETTKKFVRKLVSEICTTNVKIILDADGINAFAGYKNSLKGNNIVITPHFGEYLRLTGNESKNKIENVKEFINTGIITVLKGASTITANLSNFTINGTGNPGMAVAGSGDVLSGIIGAFATKMDLYDAARYGVLVHGLCGDEAKSIYGEESMISGDIINALPKVLNIYK